MNATRPFVCADYHRTTGDYGFRLTSDVCFSVILQTHSRQMCWNLSKMLNYEDGLRNDADQMCPHLLMCSEITGGPLTLVKGPINRL